MIGVKKFENKSAALIAAQDELNSFLYLNIGKPILLLLSGGSALAILDSIEESTLHSNITMTVLDERASNDSSINNFAQLKNTNFYKSALKKDCHFIDTTLKEGQEPKDLADFFNQSLLDWEKNNLDGIIIATMGIGPDGHTSGIGSVKMQSMEAHKFKSNFDKLFVNTDRFAVNYEIEEIGWDNPYKSRVTTTFKFLKLIDKAIVFMCGEEKKEALKKALGEKETIYSVPAVFLNKMESVEIFTDIN